MSSYRRFISYMYDCRQQQQKNCGFLKIEIRNNRCVIIFQLKNAPCQNECNVYLCFRDADPEFLFLQSIPIRAGNTNYKIETSSMNIAGSDASFSQCCGILCTDEKGNNCCTCWDSAKKLPDYTPKLTPATDLIESSSSQEAQIPAFDDAPDAKPLPATGDTSNAKLLPATDDTSNAEPLPVMDDTSSNTSDYREQQPPLSFSELWKHMQQEFSPLDPFEDHTVVESIKIAPSDLGYLQACNLELGTNQFLLHGYKCYHHLLLGRLHGQMQYVIGVPGIYDLQEQFMAKMFGFPCFKPIREYKQKNGQFGYWLRCFQ